MTDFNDLLKKGWGEIPEKKPLPRGSWLVRCTNMSLVPAKNEGQSSQVVTVFVPKEAMEDVEPDELAALLSDGYDIGENKLFHRIWLEDASSFKKVQTLLISLGVDLDGKDIESSMKAAKGHEITAYVTQRNFTSKTTGETGVVNDITEFAPVA